VSRIVIKSPSKRRVDSIYVILDQKEGASFVSASVFVISPSLPSLSLLAIDIVSRWFRALGILVRFAMISFGFGVKCDRLTCLDVECFHIGLTRASHRLNKDPAKERMRRVTCTAEFRRNAIDRMFDALRPDERRDFRNKIEYANKYRRSRGSMTGRRDACSTFASLRVCFFSKNERTSKSNRQRAQHVSRCESERAWSVRLSIRQQSTDGGRTDELQLLPIEGTKKRREEPEERPELPAPTPWLHYLRRLAVAYLFANKREGTRCIQFAVN